MAREESAHDVTRSAESSNLFSSISSLSRPMYDGTTEHDDPTLSFIGTMVEPNRTLDITTGTKDGQSHHDASSHCSGVRVSSCDEATHSFGFHPDAASCLSYSEPDRTNPAVPSSRPNFFGFFDGPFWTIALTRILSLPLLYHVSMIGAAFQHFHSKFCKTIIRRRLDRAGRSLLIDYSLLACCVPFLELATGLL